MNFSLGQFHLSFKTRPNFLLEFSHVFIDAIFETHDLIVVHQKAAVKAALWITLWITI